MVDTSTVPMVEHTSTTHPLDLSIMDTSIMDTSTTKFDLTASTFRMEDTSTTKFDVTTSTTKFDLTLAMSSDSVAVEGKEELFLYGSLEYNTHLFDGSTIERMMENFHILLKSITTMEGQAISDIGILSEEERQQLLIEWNDTECEWWWSSVVASRLEEAEETSDFGYHYDGDGSSSCTTTVHQLFEEQVKKTPDSIAVVFEDEQVSYRELNIRSNQLAHYLSGLGVGPERLVAICLERSVEMIVCIIAVLKSGAAYVPIDPHYPLERQRIYLRAVLLIFWCAQS